MSIPTEDIRYINNGEPVNAEVLNRHVQDLAAMTDEKFTELDQDVVANAIIFAIALGG
jgi:hypothetical protein